MNDEISATLKEFHDCNEEARKHFGAHKLVAGQPLKLHTEKDLMLYSKWRTKADLALNKFHTLLVRSHPDKLPYTLEGLEDEKIAFETKLKQTEDWLNSH